MNQPSNSASSLCTLRISVADMISQKVRTKRPDGPEPPDTLYQALPDKAMALFATLPHGDFAVSIPGSSGGRHGYPISKTAPLSEDGFTVVCGRKPNGRYEADRVIYHGRDYTIVDFIPVAKLWIDFHYGGLKADPNRHAYFAPSIEEWGVLQRDSGYAAWDPSAMHCKPNPETHCGLREPLGSGILARIPVFCGVKRPPEILLPVFARVEVSPDPECSSVWMSFEEHKKERILQSRVPDAILSVFSEWLSRFTKDSGFDCWIVRPGMLFGDCVEWWNDGCRRLTEHEGIDFAEGFRSGEGTRQISDGVPVRSVAEGEIAAILEDFIGKTVVVRHRMITRAHDEVFHTLLSHVQPETALSRHVAKGQIVGRVGKFTNTAAPRHLHLTGVWIPGSLPLDEIDLRRIHPGYSKVFLADFNPILRASPLCRFY